MEPNAPSQDLNHSTGGGPPRRAEQSAAIDKPFGQSVDSVLEGLETDPERGLSDQEVKRRQRRFGKNLLRQKGARSWLSILADQFRGIIVWLLAGAAAIAFYLGDLPEGIAILVVLAINGAIGFITELRAVRSMEALRRLAQVKARVRRAGGTRELDAREIVPGDIVIIEAGDIVGADMRLLQVTNLQCDESALTGESTPVEKQIEPLPADTALPDRSNMAFKGTAVARGSGRGVVTATGMATELGRVARLAELAEPEASPLERRLDQLGQRLVWLTLLLAAVITLAGVLRGRDLLGTLETGIALAVAAVPEGLPVVATLCLARGVWRMAARNALVARLSAIETLGSTTVILTDKTGTLTENEMAVVRFLLADMVVEVDDSGRGPAFTSDGEAIDAAKHPLLRMALRIGLLCNNAELPATDAGHSDTSGSGDPMELALLSAARLAGLQRADDKSDLPRIKEHAFDPDLKMMATVHRGEGECFFAVKGAPENVLERCESVLTTDGPRPLEAGDREDWVERGRHAARRGYRMLALAFKSTGDPNAAPYEALVLVGLVCLLDPLRDDIPDAIAACRRAGVRVVMLTGDHADTAAEIARQAGLGSGDLNVRQEGELERLDRGSPDWERIREADVFARVSPETKLRLASLFQSAGEIVAMTGDGVNDAPALKKADIGIAMGKRGTEVAREAAHVVLKDDAFATIVMAMREGRIIFGNIRKFVIYLLSCNVSEILVVSLAVISGLPMPLLPLQILYLNLVTDVFPAFALGLGEGDEQAMTRPPRDPKEPIVDKARWLLIGVLGGAITAATLGAFAIGLYWLKLEPDQAITMAFLTIATSQLLNVFNMRAAGAEWLNNEVVRNRYVWGALALCIVLVSLALWLPWLAELMDLPDPHAGGLVVALAMSVLPLIAGQVFLSWAANRLPSLDRP